MTFDPGTTSKYMVGTINQGAPTSYVLWASAGQTLTVQTVSRGEPLVITVSGTGGDLPLSGNNSQVSNIVTAALPSNGDYTVTIRPTVPPASPTLMFDLTFSIK